MREEHLEVKKPQRRTTADRLIDSGHLVAAGLAIVGLAAFGIDWSLRPPKEHQDAVRARATTEEFAANALRRSFPIDEKTAEAAAAFEALDRSLKAKRDAATEVPSGLTYPAEFVALVRSGGANEFRFEAPVDLRANAEPGGVDLVWADPAGNNVRIRAFEIFRKDGAKPETLVKTVGGDVFAARDESAAPGVAYVYRVRAVSAESAGSDAEAPRSAFSAAVEVKAIADFKLDLVSADASGATFAVEKRHDGVWKRRTYVVPEGGPIGSNDAATGVDFSTGRKLSRLTLETKTERLTRSEPVFDPDGRVVVENGGPKRVEVVRETPYVEATVVVEGGALPKETLVWRGR